MIRRLLWLSGYPAAYMRALQRVLDADPAVDIRYIFFRGTGADAAQRLYEQGEISGRAMVCGPGGDRTSARLIAEYARDSEAALLFCGMYPRGIAKAFLRHARSRCAKAFFSDTNVADFDFGSLTKRFFYSWILSKCDILFVMGSMNAVFYRKLMTPAAYSGKRIVHVPYPHPEAGFPARQLPLDNRPARFLFLGRLEAEKNVAALIDACDILRNEKRSFELWIAGTGSREAELKKLCVQKGLGERIRFHGAVPSNSTSPLYCQCDVFVLPSVAEPWGVVVNEALSSGLPVIAPCWAGAAADCVLDGHNGIRLLNNTPRDIAAAMRTYIANPKLAELQSPSAVASIRQSSKTLEAAHTGIVSLFLPDSGALS
jgi:glycosyltransferase involved in cell wall biosynthesis